ncbi:MAG: S41 family peptidase [Flavobacteriales bacterium]|nr:S41 family peptidase [Flavobacteriales bacterium]
MIFRLLNLTFCLLILSMDAFTQDYGNAPTIEKELLLRDLELLHQALDGYHSGMYWYTPKDSVDVAFEQAREQINEDLSVLAFHRLMAPLVGLSREDHTDIYLPDDVQEYVEESGMFLPFTVAFLGKEMYVIRDASLLGLDHQRIISINGKSPEDLVEDIGQLFASDAFIKTVKYSDLEGFSFAKYKYYFFGKLTSYEVKTTQGQFEVPSMSLDEIRSNLQAIDKSIPSESPAECLEFRSIGDTIAYLGVHSFDNGRIKENRVNKKLSTFLDHSFDIIEKQGIETVVIDVSQNGGGNEGNENLLFSYIGENYQKYTRVRAKRQNLILDNGTDKRIKLKTFGWLERLFRNKKMPDGSYERKPHPKHGLMAFDKKPEHSYAGKVFVIIGPVTYSGGSEFTNMCKTTNRATFIGQETGGGYLGNTSGYSAELTLPHSGITIDIPALQFEMNVTNPPKIGRGVLPDYEVIPTIEEYLEGVNVGLEFLLKR